MNRRTPVLAIAMVAAMTATMGAAAPTPTPTPSQSDGTLQILTYRGYAEYGATSPKANWVGDFEKETGCRIARLDTVQTSEDMARRVTERPYDVISASPDLAANLVATKQAQPIDPAKVTGFTDIPKRLRDMTTQAGKVYGVPYLWGYHEFLYDNGKVRGGGLEDVFGSAKVALFDSPMTIADAALTDASVENPFELTKEQLDTATALLGQHKDRTYWTNPLELVKGFSTGSIEYAQATPYYRMLLRKAGLPVKAVTASRTTGWLDSWMLGAGAAGTPNQDCAYRWLNWMAAPNSQRDAAAWMGLAPANPKACKGRAKLTCQVYGDDFARIAFAVRPPGDCRPPKGECTDYAAWTDRWRVIVG